MDLSFPRYLMSSVHFCACGYWRVKIESNTREQLDNFLASRDADPQAWERGLRLDKTRAE
jgi:hypothetical protein